MMKHLKVILLVFVMLITSRSVGHAQVSMSYEPLPRDFQGVKLLMIPEDVKQVLNQKGLKVTEYKGIDSSTLVYHILTVTYPTQDNFQIINYYFYEGKLSLIRVEYNQWIAKIDIKKLVSELKVQYGGPKERHEVLGIGPPLSFPFHSYYWVDDQTELNIDYVPPGKDPLDQNLSLPGDIIWVISDKDMMENHRAQLERQKK